MLLLLGRTRHEVGLGDPARQTGGGDAARGGLTDPLGLLDQLVVGRGPPGAGHRRRRAPLGRRLLRGLRLLRLGALLLRGLLRALLRLAALTAEPVGLQRVVERGAAVAAARRRQVTLPAVRLLRQTGPVLAPALAVRVVALLLAALLALAGVTTLVVLVAAALVAALRTLLLLGGDRRELRGRAGAGQLVVRGALVVLALPVRRVLAGRVRTVGVLAALVRVADRGELPRGARALLLGDGRELRRGVRLVVAARGVVRRRVLVRPARSRLLAARRRRQLRPGTARRQLAATGARGSCGLRRPSARTPGAFGGTEPRLSAPVPSCRWTGICGRWSRAGAPNGVSPGPP